MRYTNPFKKIPLKNYDMLFVEIGKAISQVLDWGIYSR